MIFDLPIKVGDMYLSFKDKRKLPLIEVTSMEVVYEPKALKVSTSYTRNGTTVNSSYELPAWYTMQNVSNAVSVDCKLLGVKWEMVTLFSSLHPSMRIGITVIQPPLVSKWLTTTDVSTCQLLWILEAHRVVVCKPLDNHEGYSYKINPNNPSAWTILRSYAVGAILK